jgi:hypothetical protein
MLILSVREGGGVNRPRGCPQRMKRKPPSTAARPPTTPRLELLSGLQTPPSTTPAVIAPKPSRSSHSPTKLTRRINGAAPTVDTLADLVALLADGRFIANAVRRRQTAPPRRRGEPSPLDKTKGLRGDRSLICLYCHQTGNDVPLVACFPRGWAAAPVLPAPTPHCPRRRPVVSPRWQACRWR